MKKNNRIKIPSVSVGIAALNEEQDITSLVLSILNQKQQLWKLQEVIVASDGSTDKTVEQIKAIKDKRVKLVNGRERKGKTFRLNQIIDRFCGDLLFLLDADVLIPDNHTFSGVISQVDFIRNPLVSVNTLPLKANNFFDRFLNYSIAVQIDIRRKWNNGVNYLAFRGCFFGLEKNFIRSIRLPNKLVNNDSYLFLKALEKKRIPKHLPDVYIFYKTPTTFRDHLAQSGRFQSARTEIKQLFTTIDIDQQFAIPKRLALQAVTKFFFLNPIFMTGYLVIFAITRIGGMSDISTLWEVAVSTKNLSYEN